MSMIHAVLAGLAVMTITGAALIVVAIKSALRHAWLRASFTALAGLVLIAVPTLAFLLPACATPCEDTPTSRCMRNLSQIGKASEMYSRLHDERFPASISALTNYLGNPKCFVCPSSGNKPGPMDTVDQWSDYVLITNLTAGSDSDLVLAYCKPENHADRDGVNVLCVDGSVTWTPTKMFDHIPCDILKHSRVSKKPQAAN